MPASDTDYVAAIEGLPDSVIEQINLADLRVDRRYQRRLDQAWIDRKVPDYNPSLVGTITVSKRSDIYFVIDGQHRVELTRQAAGRGGTIKAEVFEGLSAQQEAQLFLGLNATRRVAPYDKFHAAVTAGEADAVAIVQILDSLGLEYSSQRHDGGIQAVAALRRVFAMERRGEHVGATVLSATLRTALDAWGKKSDAFDGTIIEGLGIFYKEYLGKVDSTVLAEKLGANEGGPRGIKQSARTLRSIKNTPVARNAASVIVGIYNKGRTASRLADRWA